MEQDMSFKSKVVDMMGRNVTLPILPQRIVCLVPSLTELLFDLGLGDRVVGITKFCIKPDIWYKTKTRVGGTKAIDFKKIKVLNPDLIIGNKEENTKADIEKLAEFFNVWMSDINTYNEALGAINELAIICGQKKEGQQLVSKIEALKTNYVKPNIKNNKVLYLIWKNPYMAVGSDTFIDNVLSLLGYDNCYQESRYQELTIADMIALNPDFIFLSSEPFPFKKVDIKELQELTNINAISLVDGELFSWYGSRLIQTFSTSFFIS